MVLASLSSLGSRDIEIKIFTLIFGLNFHFITVNHQKLWNLPDSRQNWQINRQTSKLPPHWDPLETVPHPYSTKRRKSVLPCQALSYISDLARETRTRFITILKPGTGYVTVQSFACLVILKPWMLVRPRGSNPRPHPARSPALHRLKDGRACFCFRVSLIISIIISGIIGPTLSFQLVPFIFTVAC